MGRRGSILIVGLCMLFASTLVELFSETVPVWLVSIANILFFTGQMLCFISWYFLAKKNDNQGKEIKEW